MVQFSVLYFSIKPFILISISLEISISSRLKRFRVLPVVFIHTVYLGCGSEYDFECLFSTSIRTVNLPNFVLYYAFLVYPFFSQSALSANCRLPHSHTFRTFGTFLYYGVTAICVRCGVWKKSEHDKIKKHHVQTLLNLLVST